MGDNQRRNRTNSQQCRRGRCTTGGEIAEKEGEGEGQWPLNSGCPVPLGSSERSFVPAPQTGCYGEQIRRECGLRSAGDDGSTEIASRDR